MSKCDERMEFHAGSDVVRVAHFDDQTIVLSIREPSVSLSSIILSHAQARALANYLLGLAS